MPDFTVPDTRVILLNGPPSAGKSLAAAHLGRVLGAARVAFADPVKVGCHASWGLFGFNGAPCPALAFEAVKDEPLEEFGGVSPRRAYINHAEAYKAAHGADIYGKFLVRALRRRQPAPALVAVPDSGFAAEAAPVVEAVGADRVLLIRVHAAARGKTFAGDSRSHIDLPGVATVDLGNEVEGDPSRFLFQVEATVRGWLAA